MHNVLTDLLIFTATAVIFVPIFRKLKLGAILAYLFAGILIGPGALGFIKDADVILHFSELGVVFLLFLIGLELAPTKLWQLRHSIFGMGFLQVALSGTVLFGIFLLLGLPKGAAYVAGFGLALSSTAFAMQILEEKHQLNTTHGQGSFSILMFQDLAVIPLMASLAFFSPEGGEPITAAGVLRACAVILALIFVGRYAVRHLLRLVAEAETQEVFIAMSLLIVVGTAILLESVGLSMGMGAFFAGVLLANSEYRHELESNLMPFKGLLLGLFFIAVGMSLDIYAVGAQPGTVLLLTFGFMTLKALIIYSLARLFKFPFESARNIAFTLPQGGEFAFVLFAAAIAKGLLDSEWSSILSASVTLSMALTPLVFSLNQRYLRTFSEISERPYDKIDAGEAEVIIAGYGRFGQIVARFLSIEKVKYTILEHSASQVDTARQFGFKVYYGDASRHDILEAAGAAQAKIFVLAIDDPANSVETAKVVKEKFPHLEVIARVRNRQHALDLFALGIDNVHRETYLTSLEVAKEVLLSKGQVRDRINKRLATFRKHDEDVLRRQYTVRDDEKKFISLTTQANQELEEILRADQET